MSSRELLLQLCTFSSVHLPVQTFPSHIPSSNSCDGLGEKILQGGSLAGLTAPLHALCPESLFLIICCDSYSHGFRKEIIFYGKGLLTPRPTLLLFHPGLGPAELKDNWFVLASSPRRTCCCGQFTVILHFKFMFHLLALASLRNSSIRS